jgi:hypothetical protein
MQTILEYIKAHSHAILGTLVVLQNLHVLSGTANSVLNYLVTIMSAFGTN